MKQYGCEDTPPFTDTEIARKTDEATFAVYTASKRKLLEAKLAKDIGAVEKARFEAELERLEKMTEEQREIEKERRKIEDMLNPKCPRCKAVFVDFSNCAALRCGQAGCGAA